MGRFADALASQDRAIALAPETADYHATRGAALSELRRFKDAIAAYDRAIALKPAHASAWSNRANTLSELGDHHGALESFDRALALNPDHVDARFNRSLCRLLLGRFRGGWDDYRWRWKRWESEYLPTRSQPYPLLTPDNVHAPVWDGRPTPGRLLVWPEQGIGDQMLFASMLGEAQKRVGGLTLALDPRLHPLFARSFPQARIVTLEKAFIPGRFDCQIPFGNLGGIFRNDESDFLSHRRPYLKADPARTATLRRLLTAGGKRVCGIAWHSRHEKVGQDKSMRLTDLVPVLSLPGCRLVDLQYGDHAAEHDALRREAGLALARVPEIDNWNDIDGLAALINACDLIITVSNTTAHIAGALGKPVLLMLPYSTGRYWYWQTDREDSLVYPDLRIFRQAQAGDWAEVVAAVRKAAHLRLKTRKKKTLESPVISVAVSKSQLILGRAQSLINEKRFVAAVEAIDQDLKLDPHLDELHNLRGNALMALGHYADARAAYEQALTLSPANASAARNLSLCLLITGHFREAWPAYGARWQARQQMGLPDIIPPDYAQLARWDGKPLQGSLIVWHEQGLGDQILWCSMLAEARARVSSLTVAAHSKLQTLFRRSFPECEVTTANRAGPPLRHAAQIAMGDLGIWFRHSEADFLAHRRPYLKADAARTAVLRRLLAADGKRVCGIAWHSRHEKVGQDKSMRLTDLVPVLSLQGYRFVDLQYGDHAAEHDALRREAGLALARVPEIDNWNDIDGLAALINACDLIITVSNTTAHIAGALGKPVLLMLPYSTGRYWYWQSGRDDSLVYPDLRIFRQAQAGDWSTVATAVSRAAKERLSGNDVKTQTSAIVTGRLPNPQISLSRAQRFFDEDQLAEALDAVNHALALDSRLDAAHNLRGNVLMAIGRYADAGTAYEQALALTPDSAITKNNLTLCRLMTGHFRDAWRTHGARWQAWQDMGIPDIKPPNYAKLPRWEGTPLQGSLVVWGEQGIGDQILWCSMLAEARARVSSLTVAVHPKLQTLFKRAFPDCEVTTADRAGPLRRHSAQLPMGDLGALFRNSEADFLTHRRAYLQADKARAAALRLQLSSDGQMICGLSWLSRNPRSSAFKSLDFAQLHPLLSLKGFRFVNLQHDSGVDVTPAMTEVESIDKWNDLDGLAALIAACDLVVTTSNTVAHLAGALGVHVLLMLPTRPYWYWQPDRRDSLWYPKIDIFRQTASGDWAGVVRRVAKALAPPPQGRRTVAHVSRGAPAAKT